MDKIANMLITIKNGGNAAKPLVQTPYSVYRAAIAKALLDEGFISGYEQTKRERGGDLLTITLKYQENGQPHISNVKRVSKPSRRLYTGAKDIRAIRQGHGRMFLSTPKGVLSDRAARKEQVGGEILFEIW